MKKLKRVKILFRIPLSQKWLVPACFILVFAGIGVYLIVSSHAQSPYASAEAEVGSLANGAVVDNDPNASGGSYVKFGSLSTSPPADNNSAFLNTENYNDSTPLTDGSIYQVMDIQYDGAKGDGSYSPTYVAALHKENPNVKVLLYADPIFYNTGVTNSDEPSNSCVYPSAVQANPSWSIDGLMDVGSTSYQKACLSQMISEIKSAGADGVWWDDDKATPSWDTSNSQNPTQYPTNAEWETAVESFLTYAQQQMHANGLLSFGNVGDWEDGSTSGIMWQTYGAHLDGSEQEFWHSNGITSSNTTYWLFQEEEALWSSQQGKYDMMHDGDNSSETPNTYGFASMLLVEPASNSLDSFSTSIVDNGSYDGDESNYPEFAIAKEIGAATDDVSPTINALASGSTGAGTNGSIPAAQNTVYTRTFANGIVLVNPTVNTLSTILPSGTYSGSGNEPINVSGTIQVPAETGYILKAN
jgi:hypothetical protein